MTVGCVVCSDLDMVWDMSLGEVMQRNKSGCSACYQQVVHEDWDLNAQTPRTEIVHGLARMDQVDPAVIRWWITSRERLAESTVLAIGALIGAVGAATLSS